MLCNENYACFCVNYCNAQYIEYFIIVAAQYKCPILLLLLKNLFQILPHFTSYVHFKTLIGFALRVSRTKGYSFKSGTSFVELAVNGRISIYNEERQTFSHYQCKFLKCGKI